MEIKEASFKQMWHLPPLSKGSYGKRITRHYINLGFTLNPDHYSLFNFLVYMSDIANVFKFSTLLLRQFRAASNHAVRIYNVNDVKYSISLPNARKSFIYLLENGLIIQLDKKNYYMINPYLVYSSHLLIVFESKHKKECERIIASPEPIKEMQAYCNLIWTRLQKEQERLKKEQVRFNKEKLMRKHESKNNKPKRGKKRTVREVNS